MTFRKVISYVYKLQSDLYCELRGTSSNAKWKIRLDTKRETGERTPKQIAL